MANDVSPAVVKDLAPTGKLRAAINFGNTVLVQKGPNGEPLGISPSLARELAKRLGVPVEFVTFDAAGKVFETATKNMWDIAFLAIDPKRAAEISFTAPYVLIEGTYVVPEASPLKTVEDVDREGVRVAVGEGSAYDLYLTRHLKKAALARFKGGAATREAFVRDRLEVMGGINQQMAEFLQATPGMRGIPGRFMVIEQAMGTIKGREQGARYLSAFVEEMKASGFVARVLTETGQKDAKVAPAAR